MLENENEEQQACLMPASWTPSQMPLAIFALYEEMKLRFREELNSQWSGDALDFMFTNPTFRNNRFTHGTEIPSHVAMTMTRKLRDAGLLRQVAPGAGRRPAMYAFQSLIDLVRDE